MFERIVDEIDIKNYRDKFLSILKKNTKEYLSLPIGDDGDTTYCNVYWSEKYKFWVAHPVNDETPPGHYRNIFGLEEPKLNGNLTITVSINFSRKGIYNTQGVLAKNTMTGDICVFHKGLITINALKEYSEHKQSILNNYNDRIEEINGKRLVYIGDLSSEMLKENVKNFINKIANFKQEVKNRVLNGTNQNIQKKEKDEEKTTPFKQLYIANNNPLKELIDNIIKIKIGLRVLVKILIPYIINEYKNKYGSNWWNEVVRDIPPEQQHGLIEEKLDVSNCFSLLDKRWDDIFRHKIAKDFNANKVRSVRSWINILKDERNVNAHDGLDDLSSDETSYVLDIMARICNAFGADEALEKIESIIDTLDE